VKTTVAHFGGLDALVNNAGTARFSSIENAALTDLEAMLDAHLRGPINLIQASLPSLRSARGSIVNVSSVGGVIAMPGRSMYGATKAALNHLTRSLALELAPEVRVNAVLPGPVNTPIYDDLGLTVEQRDLLRTKLTHQTPMGRFAEPCEIAQWVCRLISEDSSWVTGALMCIDGGRSC
jgi:NAD(P)-dependent dehydrogenase (short-subunit alcohol dehydrogenase family)